MTSTLLDWQIISLLPLGGACLGVLGSLYLAYDLAGRQSKIFQHIIWSCTSSFLFLFTLLILCFLFIKPLYLPESLLRDFWRLIAIFSNSWIAIQFIGFIRPPHPNLRWLDLGFGLAAMGVGAFLFGGIATTYIRDTALGVIFVLPGMFMSGTLAGFSPVIQWWVLHLPEKHLAVAGALLICLAFVLTLLLSFFKLSGIALL